VKSTMSRPTEILVAFMKATFLCEFGVYLGKTSRCPEVSSRLLLPACAQIGFGLFAITSTANTVAALRTFPAIVRSASDMGACLSASPSSRVLTL